MFDTRTLRASALGFGLPFVLCLPIADGSLDLGDCAQLLGSYRVVEGAVFPEGVWPTRLRCDSPDYALTARLEEYELTARPKEYRLRFEG